MSREELLAWAGILIGIPGFLLLFFTGYGAFGAIVVAAVAFLIWLRWFLNLPAYTLIELEKKLTFNDPNAQRATYVRKQTARANHKGLTEFWIKSISSDGTIENMLIDGRVPDAIKKRGWRLCRV